MISATLTPGFVADHMIRLGQGEPLLLIHGLGHCKEGWDPLLPILAGRFDVCAVDLPGFGGADPLETTPTDVALAKWCEQLMDELEWDTAHVVGNSLGGLLALRLGAAGRARSVTALSPGGQVIGWEHTWAKLLMGFVHTAAPTLTRVPWVVDNVTGRRLAFSSLFGKPSRMTPAYGRLSLEGVARATRFDETFDAISGPVTDLAPIDAPVTIAWGTRDYLLLPRQGVRWARQLPGSRLVKLPQLGHTPMPDDPDMVADVITRTARATSLDVGVADHG